MFDKFFERLTDWNAKMLFQAALLALAALPGVLCLPPGWSVWGRSILRYGAIHWEGRSWSLLLRHINWAQLGVKCLATLQFVLVCGIAYDSTFLTPNNVVHATGATFIDLFAAIALVGILRDAWKMDDGIERSDMMRTFRLIK